MTLFFELSFATLSDTLLGEDKVFHLEYLKSGCNQYEANSGNCLSHFDSISVVSFSIVERNILLNN